MLIENVPNMPDTYIYHKDYGQIKISDFIKSPFLLIRAIRSFKRKVFWYTQERGPSL